MKVCEAEREEAMGKTKEISIPDSISSMEPVSKRRSLDVYKDNPFITASGGFCITVRNDMTLVAGGLQITDDEGEDVSAGVIGKIQTVDTDLFIKLYTKNVGLLFDLPSAAQKVLISVFCAVQKSKDSAEIYLPYHLSQEIYQELNIANIPSQSTFFRGISYLVKAGFLAGSYKGEGWYWINPALVFNGDRVRFVNEYRLKRKEELPESPEK